ANPPLAPAAPAAGSGDAGAGVGTTRAAKPSYGPPPGPGVGRTADEQQYSGVPPPNETRFRNEIVIQVVDTVPLQQVGDAAAKLGLVLISTQHLDQTHRIAYRFSLPAHANIRRLVASPEKITVSPPVGPNYLFIPTPATQ